MRGKIRALGPRAWSQSAAVGQNGVRLCHVARRFGRQPFWPILAAHASSLISPQPRIKSAQPLPRVPTFSTRQNLTSTTRKLPELEPFFASIFEPRTACGAFYFLSFVSFYFHSPFNLSSLFLHFSFVSPCFCFSNSFIFPKINFCLFQFKQMQIKN